MTGVGRAATLAAAPAERSWRRVSSLVIVGSRPCSVAPVASGGRGALYPAPGVVCSKGSFVDSAWPLEQFTQIRLGLAGTIPFGRPSTENCHSAIYSIYVVYISMFEALETNYECVSIGTNYVSVACFWQLRTSV